MTPEQKMLSRRFIYYRFFTNLWFVSAVWLYFYRLFITDQQVGIMDGMAFGIGLLAEVPAGALADKFGRDTVVRIGQILAGGGLLIQAAGSSFMPFFVGQAILMVGASLSSGADEALFFERLKFSRDSLDWRKLVMRTSQVGLIAALIATIGGGYLHNINPRIPWVLNGVAFIIASLLIGLVKDGRPKLARQKFTTELTNYLSNIKTGFKEFRLPKLGLYVPIIITVQGLFYTAGWGLLRLILLSRFHFSPFWGSIVIASSSLISVGLLSYIHHEASRISEKKIITVISLSAAASLLLSIANIGYWGYFVILTLYAGEQLLYPFMSEVLNVHAPEEYRATVLSVASFMRMLPYVVLAPIIGFLNTHNKLHIFLLGWSALIVFAVILYLSNVRSDKQIAV